MRACIPGMVGLWAAAMAAAQETPRAVQVVEPPAQAPVAADERVVSSSRQFRVSGGDSLARGTVVILAEETKKELLLLTGEQDQWKVPVSIVLHGKAGDPLREKTIASQRLVVAGVSELRLDKHLGPGLEKERFKRALTAMLLYERALNDGVTSDRPLWVPPWLTDGLREASDWRLNLSDRQLYATLFKQGGLFKIEELFGLSDEAFERLDGATRAAFRVSSGALVMALLEQPQGRDGFRAFLSEVAAYEGEMPGLLRKHFPELNLSETSLAKWWALQLAAKGGLNLLTDILTVAHTEAAMAEALRLDVRTAEGIVHNKELAAWPELAGLDESARFAAVLPAQEALVRLSYRCFPSYRPLLASYQEVLGKIANNETGEVAKTLAGLEETRATMISRAERARDYLDWFEITRARQTSGAFDDYLRLKQELKSNPHRRDDDLSKYLDRMDKIFHREDSAGPPGMSALPPP